MIAVDTNVVVRLLTGDDPKQARAASAVFASDTIWISKTVLLKIAWVLRRLYKFDQFEIAEALSKSLGLENLRVEDEPAVASAIALFARGLEFADALHLSSRPVGTHFLSFDRVFVRRARRIGAAAISKSRL
jgi:predicted nucleic-acid-binding protein